MPAGPEPVRVSEGIQSELPTAQPAMAWVNRLEADRQALLIPIEIQTYEEARDYDAALKACVRWVNKVQTRPDIQTAVSRMVDLARTKFAGKPTELALAHLRGMGHELTSAVAREVLDLAIAYVYYAADDHAKARAQVQAILARPVGSETVSEAKLVLALCHIRVGQMKQAREVLEQLVRDAKEPALRARATFMLGWIYLSEQQMKKSLDAFRQVVREHPQSPYGRKAAELIDRLAPIVEHSGGTQSR